jgi:hypothetical protein
MSNEKARSLTEQIEKNINSLADEIDAVRKSETFLRWLNAMALFPTYSHNNQILIFMQRPDARRVAGFKTWKRLGRHVKKGAKGIAILAPCVYRKKGEAENEDSTTVKKLFGFKVAWLFAEQDTDGAAIPELVYSATEGGDELLSRLEWTTDELGIELEYKDIAEPGVQGYSCGGRIVVRATLSPTETAAVLVHELIHEDLHHGKNRDDAKQKTRNQRELEAEATTYVVLRHFGIDHVASNYLATYNVNGEQLHASLATISAAAKRLIAAIEGDSSGTETVEAASFEENRAPA